MGMSKEIESAVADAVRKMPDAQLVELLKTQLNGDAVPEPEPRRKGRKMRRAVPAKTKGRRTKKPELTEYEARILKVVQRARNPLTVQVIAKRLKLRPDTIRPLLKRLAANKLIEMTPEGNGKKRVHRWLFSAK